MGTPTADKLRVYFPSKYLSADGDPLTQFTADNGSLNTIIDAALIEADGYWDGAIGWFDGNTLTPELQGKFFHVKNFDDASDTLTLSRDLPGVPVAGDTFRLVLGGNWRSSQETFGMALGGVLPELSAVTGTNITGLTIKKASAKLGEGVLSVFYENATEEMFIKMDAQNFGIGLDVSADVTDGVIYAEDGQSWIQVDVVAASLPVGDQTDTFTMSYPETTLTPDYEGYETNNGIGGKTRYRLEAIKNADLSDTMVDLSVYISKPFGAPGTINTGESLGLTDDSIDVTDPSTWPTKGFWIKNTTVNAGAGDCRYVKYRSGDTLYALGVDWATLGFANGSVQINQGDAITDPISGATAIVDQVTLASGTWGGGDAAGTLLIKKVVGTFNDTNNIEVSATPVATSDGDSVLGLRGYTAVVWSQNDAIELMSDIDIGFDKPGALQYENPASETIVPDGVIFTDGSNLQSSVSLSNLASDKLHGVWRREWILEGHQARDGITADTNYAWS